MPVKVLFYSEKKIAVEPWARFESTTNGGFFFCFS